MGYHHSSQGPNEIEEQEGGRIITISITTVSESQYSDSHGVIIFDGSFRVFIKYWRDVTKKNGNFNIQQKLEIKFIELFRAKCKIDGLITACIGSSRQLESNKAPRHLLT